MNLKYSSNLSRLWIFFAIIVVGFIIGLGRANYSYSVKYPGGNDFLVNWMGTRELLLHGHSPYSDETAQIIQKLAYGNSSKSGDQELRFVSPLYSVSIFFPYALIADFNLARAIWMTVLEISLLLIAYLTIRLSDWKPGIVLLAIFFIFSLLGFHSFSPLINGNPVILVTLAITGAFLAIKNGADELAGVLFALSMIKPHNVFLVIIFVFLWAGKLKRWRIMGWFSVTMILLIISSILIIPDWIIQNLREVIRFSSSHQPANLGSALIMLLPGWGERIKWAITFILALILLLEWGKVSQPEFRIFYWTASITLVISQWIGIQTNPGNFFLLFPCLPLIFAIWDERWKAGGQVFSLGSMLLLSGGIWMLFLETIKPGLQTQQNPSMFIPLPLFLFITLYWVRYWAIHPQKIWMDDLISIDNSRNY